METLRAPFLAFFSWGSSQTRVPHYLNAKIAKQAKATRRKFLFIEVHEAISTEEKSSRYLRLLRDLRVQIVGYLNLY